MIDFTEKFGSFAGALQALVILIVGLILLKVVTGIVAKALEKSKIDKALHRFVINAVKVFGWVFIIVSMLSALNVNTTVFVSVLSAAGAAIAIALKDSLANIAGGVLLIINKPFGRGDYVQIGDCEGTVEDIDLMSSSLITLDNRKSMIPNGMISTSPVTNYTMLGTRHVAYQYLVDYKSDIEQVKTVLENVALSNPYILKDMDITTLVAAHLESGIAVTVKLWVNAADYWPSDAFMNENVKLAFDEAGITIPYNHIDVKVAKA